MLTFLVLFGVPLLRDILSTLRGNCWHQHLLIFCLREVSCGSAALVAQEGGGSMPRSCLKSY